jgi:hypothetical protein
MSFWKNLFGGGGTSAGGGDKAAEAVEYNGFIIRPAPFKDGSQFQTAGTIEKEIGGVKREHKFIRADRHGSYEDAASFTLSKARQMIDQMGDRLFDMR